jgi:hypothetical protein
MNEAFRQYAFGRAFRLDLSERHTDALAAICRNEAIASYGLGGSTAGLIRRGLIEHYLDGASHARVRPTRAGLLVYQLLVEAGEHAELDAKRRAVLEHEHEQQQAEWDRRFAEVPIRLKERYLRPALPGKPG